MATGDNNLSPQDQWLNTLGVSPDSFAAAGQSAAGASSAGSKSSSSSHSTGSKSSAKSGSSQGSSASQSSGAAHSSSSAQSHASTSSTTSTLSTSSHGSGRSSTSHQSESSNASGQSASSQGSSHSASSKTSASSAGSISSASSTSTSSASSGGSATSSSSAVDSRAQGVAARIGQKLKSDADLRSDLTMLSSMDMKALLDVIQALKKAGNLEDFADHVTSDRKRIGAAILTIRPELDVQWEELVGKLNEDDRNAILARVPADVRKRFGKGGASPSGGPSKGKDKVEPGGVISVGPGGAEVQAKLTFHSDLVRNLGETEFTIHIGPDGKLSQFEVDVTAVKAKLEKMGVLSRMLELEATLSLNSTVDLDQKATKVIFGKVQTQVKGEIEAHFKDIKALESVSFKLTATAGSGGFSVTGSIEIRIPGT